MKRFSTLLATAAIITGTLAPVQATAFSPDDDTIQALEQQAETAVTAEQWAMFSENLVDALGSEHSAIQNAAMRLVITHGQKVNVDKALFDIVRIYRDGKDAQARRMAIVTLASLDNAWANDFLQRSARFEKSDTLKKTIRAVVAQNSLNRA